MGSAQTTAHDIGRSHVGAAMPPSSFDSLRWVPAALTGQVNAGEEVAFVYHGWQFALRADADASGVGGFSPVTFWRMNGKERMTLPTLRDRFDSEHAALECAERQAVRWVREHMGYGGSEF